jgi:hypothetical protein
MPSSFGAALSSYRSQFKISVKNSGRLKAPKLDNGQFTKIGQAMVAAQLERWSKGINANGAPAKPLSPKYAAMKRIYTRNEHPIRDNKMTGALVKNFQLRKAMDGVIRAEPTQRLTRTQAQRAEQYEEMIGLAPSDQVTTYRAIIEQYSRYPDKAWEPVKND